MRRYLKYLVVALLAYGLVAYIVLPWLWRSYEHRHPWVAAIPDLTQTKDGVPGDPLNVALVGSREDVEAAMKKAGWFPADPLGWRSDLRIAADTVLERPYPEAPVSNLYLFGRREDLAFEQPVGNDPKRRHHVRFWLAPKPSNDGRSAWIGAVTFDERVGLSHRTGQITHHIDAHVDNERDRLLDGLQQAGQLISVDDVAGFHPVHEGKNGGGDRWVTDGRLRIGMLAESADEAQTPEEAPPKEDGVLIKGV